MLPFVAEQMQSAKKKEGYSAKKKRKERGLIVKKNFMMDISIYGIHQFPSKTLPTWLGRSIRGEMIIFT